MMESAIIFLDRLGLLITWIDAAIALIFVVWYSRYEWRETAAGRNFMTVSAILLGLLLLTGVFRTWEIDILIALIVNVVGMSVLGVGLLYRVLLLKGPEAREEERKEEQRDNVPTGEPDGPMVQ